MLLFRSEEHIDRWCQAHAQGRGGTMSLATGWQLGISWYGGRLRPDWRRKRPEEAEAVFSELGLTGDFWRLR